MRDTGEDVLIEVDADSASAAKAVVSSRTLIAAVNEVPPSTPAPRQSDLTYPAAALKSDEDVRPFPRFRFLDLFGGILCFAGGTLIVIAILVAFVAANEISIERFASEDAVGATANAVEAMQRWRLFFSVAILAVFGGFSLLVGQLAWVIRLLHLLEHRIWDVRYRS